MKIKIIILLCFIPVILQAEEEPFWEYIGGPNGGRCTGITYNPTKDVFYLKTQNGIYKSTNRGNSWELYYINMNTNWRFYPDYSINEDGTILGYDINNSKLYIRDTNGIIKYLSHPFQLNSLKTILLTNKNEILLLSEISDNNDTISIMRSRDFGETWDILLLFRSGLVDYDNKEKIDIRTRNSIYSYTNGYFFTAAIDAKNSEDDKTLLILIDTSFSPTDTIICPHVGGFLINDSNIVGTGSEIMAFSSNLGNTWEISEGKTGMMYQKDENIYFYTFSTKDKSIFEYSILVSNDFGRNWMSLYKTRRNMGFPIVTKNNNFYGANLSSFYRLDGNKGTWTRQDKGIKSLKINNMSYSHDGIIYAVSYGVFKSTDNGDTWEYAGLDDQRLEHILVADNGYVFVSGGLGSILKGNIFRSTDGGKTWEWLEKIYNNNTYHISDLYKNRRGHIYASVHGVAGYFYSTDYGDTWNYKAIEGDYKTNCFATNSEGHIFRGAYAGIVFRSTDDGDTWEQMTEYFSGDNCFWDISTIAFDPKGGNGYALCLKTTDNGRTWRQFNHIASEIPEDAASKFDSLGNYLRFEYAPNVVYEVHRSTNQGLDWENISSGLEHKKWSHLSVSPDGYYFLGAEYGGMYRSRKNYVSVEEKPRQTDAMLLPNPATDYVDIMIDNHTLQGMGDIKIYDVLGVCVLEQTAEHPAVSRHPSARGEFFRVDVSGLAAGVYFVRVGGRVLKFVKL